MDFSNRFLVNKSASLVTSVQIKIKNNDKLLCKSLACLVSIFKQVSINFLESVPLLNKIQIIPYQPICTLLRLESPLSDQMFPLVEELIIKTTTIKHLQTKKVEGTKWKLLQTHFCQIECLQFQLFNESSLKLAKAFSQHPIKKLSVFHPAGDLTFYDNMDELFRAIDLQKLEEIKLMR